jgi:DhnA family fructose-bisphosphate aldolase class Ia
MAANAATELGMTVKAYPYPSGMGKSGGPYRNRQMLKEAIRMRDEEGADIVIYAFHPDIKNSKGTKDMISAAMHAGVRVRLFEVAS